MRHVSLHSFAVTVIRLSPVVRICDLSVNHVIYAMTSVPPNLHTSPTATAPDYDLDTNHWVISNNNRSNGLPTTTP
jgi:hypothetical protein